MTKIILTRNFKGTTAAKYCAAEFGKTPDSAVEINELELTDAEVVGSYRFPETRGFSDFGCGILIVGNGELPKPAPKPETGKVVWTGGDFRFDGSRNKFRQGKRLRVNSEGLMVLE